MTDPDENVATATSEESVVLPEARSGPLPRLRRLSNRDVSFWESVATITASGVVVLGFIFGGVVAMARLFGGTEDTVAPSTTLEPASPAGETSGELTTTDRPTPSSDQSDDISANGIASCFVPLSLVPLSDTVGFRPLADDPACGDLTIDVQGTIQEGGWETVVSHCVVDEGRDRITAWLQLEDGDGWIRLSSDNIDYNAFFAEWRTTYPVFSTTDSGTAAQTIDFSGADDRIVAIRLQVDPLLIVDDRDRLFVSGCGRSFPDAERLPEFSFFWDTVSR